SSPLADPLQSNEQLARAVCLALAIPTEVITQGFAQAGSDPGGFQIKAFSAGERQFSFHDAFSCNDLASLSQLWARYAQDEAPTIFFNPRADRPDRTREFLDYLPQ